VVEQLRVELQAKGLEAARREEAAAKLQQGLEERIVYLTKEHEVQLARVAASQEEAHVAALRQQAVALRQREAVCVQAVRDDLDELRRRMEEQAASHVAALQRQAAEAAAPRATTASVASLFEKIGRLSAEEMKRVVQVGQGLA
jgi:hypothetical protein